MTIVTLHDIANAPILVNLDHVQYIRQADTHCIVYMCDSVSVKVKETLNDIGKFVNSPKKIF